MYGVMMAVLMGILPMKNTYMGVRVVSLSTLPSSFVMQFDLGNFRVGPDIGIHLDKLTTITTPASDSIDTANSNGFRVDLGIEFLSTVIKRNVNGKEISGFISFRPGFSYEKSRYHNMYSFPDDSVHVKSNTYSFSANAGSEIAVKVFGLEPIIQLKARLFEVTYANGTETHYQQNEANTTDIESLNFDGFRLTSGSFQIWLLFKF